MLNIIIGYLIALAFGMYAFIPTISSAAKARSWFLCGMCCGCTSGSGPRINLQVESDVKILLLLHGMMSQLKENFEKSCNVLGITEVFTWHGFSAEDWQSDIETRITKIQIKKEKASLDLIEERLSKLISPELRAKIELKELEEMLAK